MRIPDLDEKFILYLRHHTGALAFAALACATAYSAVLVRAQSYRPPSREEAASKVQIAPIVFEQTIDETTTNVAHRWFNAREARPARVIWMTVTAYSPDHRSCGKFADGITATLHSVATNGMKLAAADPRLLPYGSMLSIPGYDNGMIIPVLDCGGAIKGNRLDLLFPTHEQALEWGVKRLPVTVWEYADGKPADDPRKLR